jgi:hypothetical protein
MVANHKEALRYHIEADIALSVARSYANKDAARSANVDAVLRELEESLEEVGGFLAVEEEEMKTSRAAAIARDEEATTATRKEEGEDGKKS